MVIEHRIIPIIHEDILTRNASEGKPPYGPRLRFGLVLHALAAAVWLGVFVSEAPAQAGARGRGNQNQQRGAMPAQQQPTVVNLKGKIEAIKAGMVKIGTTAGESWMVKIPRAAEIHVLGAAKPDFLCPGQFVSFKVKLDQRGMAQEKLTELKIFTPSKSSVLGLFPESGFSGGPDAAKEAEAEAKTKKKRKTRGKSKAATLKTAVYEVNGRIAGVKRNGQWLVKTPHGDVTFELAEDVAISFDLAEYSHARPGDAISCTGLQNGQGMATADSMQIELAQPLPYTTGKKQKTPRSRSAKGRKSKSANAADKNISAEQAEKLASLLKPKGDNATGETLELTIKGQKVTFNPSIQGPAVTLQKRFGRPKKSYAKGTLVTVDGAAKSPEKWQIWI